MTRRSRIALPLATLAALLSARALGAQQHGAHAPRPGGLGRVSFRIAEVKRDAAEVS